MDIVLDLFIDDYIHKAINNKYIQDPLLENHFLKRSEQELKNSKIVNKQNNSKDDISFLYTYRNSSIASFIELSLGQPLDRIKIECQSKNILTSLVNGNINIIKWYNVLPTQKGFFKYWYAGNISSIIQRCGIYLPAIYISNNIFDNKIGYDMNNIQKVLIKPLFVSGIITPYVCFFEGIKTAQQKQIYPVNGLRDIIKYNTSSGNTRRLFTSALPTFGREYFFIMGMCSLQPYLLANKSITNNNWITSSCLSAFISQTISQPFDVIKTKKELYPEKSLSGIKKLILNETNELKGYNKITYFYQGWTARTVRGAWTFLCMNYLVNLLKDI